MLGLEKKLYATLAGKSGLRKSQSRSGTQVTSFIPTLKAESLLGGFRYYDAQMDDRQLANRPCRYCRNLRRNSAPHQIGQRPKHGSP
jgi:glycerol-3-phosphate dehydrogenase